MLLFQTEGHALAFSFFSSFSSHLYVEVPNSQHHPHLQNQSRSPLHPWVSVHITIVFFTLLYNMPMSPTQIQCEQSSVIIKLSLNNIELQFLHKKLASSFNQTVQTRPEAKTHNFKNICIYNFCNISATTRQALTGSAASTPFSLFFRSAAFTTLKEESETHR